MKMITTPSGILYEFRCPGCEHRHHFKVGEHGWSFNGDMQRPTFEPSLLVRSGHFSPSHKEGDDCWCTFEKRYGKPPGFKCYQCHLFLRDGKIQFLPDCTHALVGQTVDLK